MEKLYVLKKLTKIRYLMRYTRLLCAIMDSVFKVFLFLTSNSDSREKLDGSAPVQCERVKLVHRAESLFCLVAQSYVWGAGRWTL